MWPFTRGRGHPWTATPARPIRYSLFQRVADWRTGRRDGRNGIPAVPPELISANARPDFPVSDAPIPPAFRTSRLAELAEQYHGCVEDEYARFQRYRAEQAEEHNTAVARVEVADDELEQARSAYAAASTPLPDERLKTRRITEGQLPDVHVRQRRTGAHDRVLAAARERLDTATKEYHGATAALRTIDMRIDKRREWAAGQSRRLRRHEQRRKQVYWQYLVRWHPYGDVLNGRLEPAGQELPDWATKDPSSPTRPDGDHPLPDLWTAAERPPRW